MANQAWWEEFFAMGNLKYEKFLILFKTSFDISFQVFFQGPKSWLLLIFYLIFQIRNGKLFVCSSPRVWYFCASLSRSVLLSYIADGRDFFWHSQAKLIPNFFYDRKGHFVWKKIRFFHCNTAKVTTIQKNFW